MPKISLENEKRMVSIPQYIQQILQGAVVQAIPEFNDTVQVVPQKSDAWDY